ncbi:PTS system mannose/fructose/sorbose family transporter subunit IID [Collinsella stercoris]|uniref:PTS system mannose/fructose/sorbose family transporter subunit IID n=1 Tax=Collinsella stercoris TaxID=147206 RepID=UPI00248E75F5|nr:PTS system mannose/fructose/sorbose family transporter subunit IID [Collinsella stercoris]
MDDKTNATQELTASEKATLNKMFVLSHSVFLGFNMTTMEANGFTVTMSPAIEEIYADDSEGKREAYRRHQSFFNTHAVAFNFIAGLVYALERDLKAGKVTPGVIDAAKASLMGPTAGMFDSLFFNCLRVIGAGVAMGLCAQGNALGVLAFILIYGVSQSVLKFILLRLGYTLGISAIDAVFESGLMQVAAKAASILGLIMVGAMTATTVNVPLAWTLGSGDTAVVIGDLLDGIYPGILSIAIVMVCMWLTKKGVRPLQIILGIIAIALLGAFLGVF